MTTSEPFRPDPLRQVLRSVLLTLAPRSRIIASLPPGNPAVALTFDDGPHPEWTPRILDALAEHGAQATFFVVGERAALHPEIVRRIAAEGHAVGHHSWTHSEPSVTPATALLAENRRTRELLETLLHQPAPLFRPPHGKLTPLKLLGAWSQGNVLVLWNRDPKDYQMFRAAELRAWVTAYPLSARSIVLLHDTHAHTAEALPHLLSGCRLPFIALSTP